MNQNVLSTVAHSVITGSAEQCRAVAAMIGKLIITLAADKQAVRAVDFEIIVTCAAVERDIVAFGEERIIIIVARDQCIGLLDVKVLRTEVCLRKVAIAVEHIDRFADAVLNGDRAVADIENHIRIFLA